MREQTKTLREESYPKTKNVTLDITGLRVEMLGPAAAYVTCKWKQSQESEGKLENASGRMTLIFRKIGKRDGIRSRRHAGHHELSIA